MPSAHLSGHPSMADGVGLLRQDSTATTHLQLASCKQTISIVPGEMEQPPALPSRPSPTAVRQALEEIGAQCQPEVSPIPHPEDVQAMPSDDGEAFFVRNLDTGERFHALDHEDSLNKLLEGLTVLPPASLPGNNNATSDKKHNKWSKQRRILRGRLSSGRAAAFHPTQHLRLKFKKATIGVSHKRDRLFRKPHNNTSNDTHKSNPTSDGSNATNAIKYEDTSIRHAACIKPDPVSCSSAAGIGTLTQRNTATLSLQHTEVQSLTSSADDDKHSGKPVRVLEFSSDGRLLASAGDGGRILVWERHVDRNTNEHGDGDDDDDDDDDDHHGVHQGPRLAPNPLCEYEGHREAVLCLAWSRGHFFASGSADGLLRLWHVSRPDSLCEFRHPEPVIQVAFHPHHETKLLTASSDGVLRVWNAKKGRVVCWIRTPAQVSSTCFSPDGSLVVAGLVDGTCVLYRFANLEFYGQLECRNRRGVHRDGRAVVGLTCIPRPGYAELELLRRRRKKEGHHATAANHTHNHKPLSRSSSTAPQKQQDTHVNTADANATKDDKDSRSEIPNGATPAETEGDDASQEPVPVSAPMPDSTDSNISSKVDEETVADDASVDDDDDEDTLEPMQRMSWKSQTQGWLIVATTHDSRVRLLDPVTLTCVTKCKGLASGELPVAATVSGSGTMICCGTSSGRVCVWDLENGSESASSAAASATAAGPGAKRHVRRLSVGTAALRLPTSKRKLSLGDLRRDGGSSHQRTALVEKTSEWYSFQANGSGGAVTSCVYVPSGHMFRRTPLPAVVVGGEDGTISWFETSELRLSM